MAGRSSVGCGLTTGGIGLTEGDKDDGCPVDFPDAAETDRSLLLVMAPIMLPPMPRRETAAMKTPPTITILEARIGLACPQWGQVRESMGIHLWHFLQGLRVAEFPLDGEELVIVAGERRAALSGSPALTTAGGLGLPQ
jgi:hypothetical protein